MKAQCLRPDFIISGDGVSHTGVVRIDEDGIISIAQQPAAGDTLVPLAGRTLLPGFVNAHSHAHQRALRGRVERKSPQAPHDDFWTWRTEMYRRTAQATPEQFERIATWAFADMLRAGFTSVGEFHYLHNGQTGGPKEMTTAVCRAAERTGIRMCLLQTAYVRGGFDKPLSTAQTRFAFSSLDAFWAHVLWTRDNFPDVQCGVALHSVRACPEEWIRTLAERARAENMPLHIHAAEQRAEVAACREATGMTPVEWLDACSALSPTTVLIHATHLEPEDVEVIARTGTQVCLCPTTERNLADGLCPIRELNIREVSLSIGTDSHARIDPFAELRALEDHERLRTEHRCVLEGKRPGLAPAILPAGTRGGRRALFGAHAAAAIARGGDPVDALVQDFLPGDLVAVKTPPEMRFSGPVLGIDALLMSANASDVTDVWRAGRHVVDAHTLRTVDVEALCDELARTVFHAH